MLVCGSWLAVAMALFMAAEDHCYNEMTCMCSCLLPIV